MSSQADSLKAEGNALFVKGDLEAAHTKYTEAIRYDDRHAILYSNRVACCLGLRRYGLYVDVIWDRRAKRCLN